MNFKRFMYKNKLTCDIVLISEVSTKIRTNTQEYKNKHNRRKKCVCVGGGGAIAHLSPRVPRPLRFLTLVPPLLRFAFSDSCICM